MRGLLFLLVMTLPLHAEVVGVSKPAQPLTAARIRAELPKAQQGPWLAYVERSAAQKQRDMQALADERKGMEEIPPLPAQGNSGRGMPLDRDEAFYKSDEARKIGDAIVSFQTPAGGWSKNLPMREPRLKGQSYAAANLAPVKSTGIDFDKPPADGWDYVGTLDNDATNTELRFLALLSGALPGHEGDVYRASLLRGLHYLLAAQFPNGGWPQVWPLQGEYHDAITFNDDAVMESAESLRKAAAGERVTDKGGAVEDFSFVPSALRERARVANEKALQCILAAQVKLDAPDGKGEVLTIWAQQNDPLTLAPVAARNFEPAALSTRESVDIMEYLMDLPHPSPAVVRSLDGAAAWLESHKIMGIALEGWRNTPGGRHVVEKPGAGPIWARFYSLTTQKPVFGDRDRTLHDNMNEISLERRNGYGWYDTDPQRALADFAQWKAR